MLGAFGAADLIDGLGQLRFDVVAVKRDLGFGEMLKGAREERFAEVLADLRDLLGLTAMRAQVLDEPLVGRAVAAGRDEDRGAPIDVGEHGDVVLAALEARLIDAETRDRTEILALERVVDVVMHDPPQAGVVLADQGSDRGDRHLLGQRSRLRAVPGS